MSNQKSERQWTTFETLRDLKQLLRGAPDYLLDEPIRLQLDTNFKQARLSLSFTAKTNDEDAPMVFVTDPMIDIDTQF